MKSMLSVLLLAVIPTTAAIAADATPAPGTNEALAQKMLDPTQNASAFKDPQAFLAWANSMSNPAASAAVAQMGMDPTTYLRMLSGMMNPAALQNYMQFTDPSMAMKWMAAGIDPRTMGSMAGMAANPAMYGNWMQAPVNPQMWAPATQMMNPAMYGNWMQAPMSPGAMNAMTAPMNPNMYMNWTGAMADPRTYGGMAPMMNMPAAMPAIDPSILLKLLQSMPIPAAR